MSDILNAFGFSKNYKDLLSKIENHIFPAGGGEEQVLISWPNYLNIEDCIDCFKNPFDGNNPSYNWLLKFNFKLFNMWFYTSLAKTDFQFFEEQYTKLYPRQFANFCNKFDIDAKNFIEPELELLQDKIDLGCPWHLPYLALLSNFSIRQTGEPDGIYARINGKLHTNLRSADLGGSNKTVWGMTWKIIENWSSRLIDRGYFVAVTEPNWRTLIGYVAQQGLVEQRELRTMQAWLSKNLRKGELINQILLNQCLASCKREYNGGSIQLNATCNNNESKKKLLSILMKHRKLLSDHEPNEVVQFQNYKFKLVLELDQKKFSSMFWVPAKNCELISGDFCGVRCEWGGGLQFLRVAGENFPLNPNSLFKNLFNFDVFLEFQGKCVWEHKPYRIFKPEDYRWIECDFVPESGQVIFLIQSEYNLPVDPSCTPELIDERNGMKLIKISDANNVIINENIFSFEQEIIIEANRLYGGIRIDPYKSHYFSFAPPNFKSKNSTIVVEGAFINDDKIIPFDNHDGFNQKITIKDPVNFVTSFEIEIPIIKNDSLNVEDFQFGNVTSSDVFEREIFEEKIQFQAEDLARLYFIQIFNSRPNVSYSVAKEFAKELLGSSVNIDFFLKNIIELGHIKTKFDAVDEVFYIEFKPPEMLLLEWGYLNECAVILRGGYDWWRLQNSSYRGIRWSIQSQNSATPRILAIGSVDAIKNLARDLGAVFIKRLTEPSPIPTITKLKFANGFPFQGIIKILNPFMPNHNLTYNIANQEVLTNLFGDGSSIIFTHQINEDTNQIEHYITQIVNNKIDGWSKLQPGDDRILYKWEVVKQAWSRLSEFTKNPQIKSPSLIYNTSNKTLFIPAKLGLPAKTRHWLAESNGLLPNLIYAEKCLFKNSFLSLNSIRNEFLVTGDLLESSYLAFFEQSQKNALSISNMMGLSLKLHDLS